ncbi:hypothetical protein E3P81_01570 [Wallemia ichthyophaga]|uniref:Immunoreactive mannoprotein MP88 n=1 Tax=Wallemia ichthyophaga TaxID=245174 RepID=A0A4V4LTZ0_WALIC|nr:hypothetical protein E3P97_01571 [Wallemia ichthyophaga]TIB06677.1 hypothetical protein E3P96_00248 [Wallemia ichthyophaga]TIB29311.1 hypothetical protein E3P86_03697 [Wallemia ichthyophaga]TIB33675.1 hypothetical protein E3P85_01223 [Wallemia ichthyophaga]TIB47694.1 hypothetical protein E3P82_01569 [Wallemia ichthyophaga]
MVGKLSLISLAAVAGVASAQSIDYPGVVSSNENGPTNPDEPELGTDTPDDSTARLLTVNNIDDFCIFGPKEADKTIGDTESEQVAWCTQPRNNARLIPEDTFTGLHFVKTPYYIQLQGWGDLTKIGVKDGDYGGELDPHGAEGNGNPVGGNVTSNITGDAVFYEEWMEFISYEQFCLRVCTAADDMWDASTMCEHKLDEMGCGFIMPGDYAGKQDEFISCDADAAFPPGVYPDGDGYSTFNQRYTGTITSNTYEVYTVGDTATPSAPYSTPSSSNCATQSSLHMYVHTESESDGPQSTSDDSGNSSTQAENGDSGARNMALGAIATVSIGLISAFAVLS